MISYRCGWCAISEWVWWMASLRCGAFSCVTREETSARCRGCSRARRRDLVGLRHVGKCGQIDLRSPPPPARQIDAVEVNIEFACLLDHSRMTGSFCFPARAIGDAEEHVAVHRFARPRIGHLEFGHLFDLFLRQLNSLPIVGVAVEEGAGFLGAPGGIVGLKT